jgi:hypothetical protein
MRAVVLAAVALAAGAAAAPARKPPLARPPALRAPAPPDVTRCSACHVVTGWAAVRFNHDPTGFPLRGQHQQVRCRDCHAHDFTTRIADTCSGCHRDRHGGELGVRCESCHEERSWRPLFQADAHRRTAFPLTGKHGLIPCQECHGNMRDRAFTRAPLACVGCHRADYDRTRLTALDHAAARFGTECQGCHDTNRFAGANFPGHDACFRISRGPHRGISCLKCHTASSVSTTIGTCNSNTAACTGCHTHDCTRTDRQHREVMGYECRDRKCYECHRNAGD